MDLRYDSREKTQYTTIFNVHWPVKINVDLVGRSTVIKHQWILLQELNITEHPYDAVIHDSIETVKDKQNNSHNIIITIEGNESFISSKGRMAKLCREFKLYDPLQKNHGDEI